MVKAVKWFYSLALILALTLCAAIFCDFAPDTAYAVEYESLIQSSVGRVTSPDSLNIVEMYGTYSNKGLYAKNVRFLIKDKESKVTLTELNPVNNAGYSPSFILGNFTGGRIEQIFLGINSGGSGGFGYYYVFDLSDGSVKTIFDSTECAENIDAKYADNYRIIVKNDLTSKKYSIDISAKGEDYLSQLYGKDGQLLKPVAAQVYPVGTVFPYYNSTFGTYQLETTRQISGLYHADGVGNVFTLLKFNGKRFEPYFENVGVYGYTRQE